jgi:Mg2+-importing ATPase
MAFDSSCDALGQASAASLFYGRLNSKFETGIRSPLDTAILAGAEPEGSTEYTKVDEIPFDFERRRLSIVVDTWGMGSTTRRHSTRRMWGSRSLPRWT